MVAAVARAAVVAVAVGNSGSSSSDSRSSGSYSSGSRSCDGGEAGERGGERGGGRGGRGGSKEGGIAIGHITHELICPTCGKFYRTGKGGWFNKHKTACGSSRSTG